MSPKVVGAALAVAAAVTVYALWPKGPSDPEAQVRQLVAQCVAAAEEKKMGVIADAIADDFRGPEGADKQMVKAIIAGQILRNSETIAVFNPTLDVSIKSPTAAEMSGRFLFARAKAKSVEALPPGAVASAYVIEATLEKRESDWQFVRASYRRIDWP